MNPKTTTVVSQVPNPPEFSRVIVTEQIPRNGLRLEFEATAEERLALAERFALEALKRLHVKAAITTSGESLFDLKVTFIADVLQLCVVTLEPVASRLSQDFQVLYTTNVEDEEASEIVVDAEADDPPERVLEGLIDVGEMVSQHLAMIIDPYPRAPEADTESWQSAANGSQEDDNPFVKLAGLAEKT